MERYGGSHRLRESNLLESAVARAENTAHYDLTASVPSVGASLTWGLIKNHPFIDGNKRAGFGALVTFLKLSGYALTCSEAEEAAAVLRVAASEMSYEQWMQWTNSAPARR